MLSQIMLQVISNGKLSLLASNAAAIGKRTAKNLMVSESVEGYALLLENVLRFPSEVADVQSVMEIPANLKAEWLWNLFESSRDTLLQDGTRGINQYLDEYEKLWNHTQKEGSVPAVVTSENFFYSIWEEEKIFQMAYMRKRREDDEVSLSWCFSFT